MCIVWYTMPACARKTFVKPEDELVQPKHILNKKLQIAGFVNLSKEQKLDQYKESIPRTILDHLSDLKSIRFPSKHPALENKDQILTAEEKVNREDWLEMKAVLDNIKDDSEDILSDPAGKANPEKKIEKHLAKIDKAKSAYWKKKFESEKLRKYMEHYKKTRPAFKSYLGINIFKPSRILYSTANLTLVDKLIDLKTIKIFDVDQIYPEIVKSKVDFTIVGAILKQKSKVVINLKMYDYHGKDFILSQSFRFSAADLEENLEDKIKLMSKKIIKELTRFPKGELIIETSPKGAFVFVDKDMIGHSNLKSKVKVGFHKIEILKDGYEKVAGEVYIEKNKKQKLVVKLNKKSKQSSVVISSEPPGADVFFDMEYKGKSPLIIDKLPQGVYKIRLEKSGYKHSYSGVELKGQKKLLLSFEMKKGKTRFKDVNDLSKNYNIAKNIFFYSTFVSLSAMLVAYLRTEQYKTRGLWETESSTPDVRKYNMYKSKYNDALALENATVYASIGLIALTAIFQMLELFTEDVEVGFSVKEEKKTENPMKKNTRAGFQVQFKF